MSQEVQGMLIRLEATTAQLRQEMARADATVAQVSGRIDRQLATVDAAFDRAGLSAMSAASMLRNASGLIAGSMSIGSLVAQADAYATIASRLRLVTSTAAEFNAAQQAVFSIAQSSFQPLTATAELYQRIATNQRELGLSGQQVAGIVGTISKTMAISGASAASANAALIQLGQAFASGVLRGEELNSVMEQAPALAQAIAAGMGKSVGELRTLGAAGKLTAEAVVKALQSQQKAVEDLYAKTSVTIGNSITAMGNSYTQLVGKLDQMGGVSAKVGQSILSISSALDGLVKDNVATVTTLERFSSAAETLAYIVGGRLVLGFGQAVVGFGAATAASLKQAGALAYSTAASIKQANADAAAASQAVVLAKSRQADAQAVLARVEAELAADRQRQQSAITSLKAVQTQLVAERQLEEQRLAAQISEQGRAAARNRMALARLDEVAIIKQIQAAETQLAATTAATSQARAMAITGVAETTLAVNAAVQASNAATATAASASSAWALATTAGRGLLSLLTGPVGLIAMTAAVAYSFISLSDNSGELEKRLGDLADPTDKLTERFERLNSATQAVTLRELRSQIAETQQQIAQMSGAMADKFESDLKGMGAAGADGLIAGLSELPADTRAALELVRKASKDQADGMVVDWKAVADQLRTMPGVTEKMAQAIEEGQTAVTDLGSELAKQQKALATLTGETDKNTTAQIANNAAQAAGGQTKAQLAEWDKYLEKLTETRDLLGANAEAEARYRAAKMGLTEEQAKQAEIIAKQTDTLKKIEDAVKQNDKVKLESLRKELTSLYTLEQAQIDAAAAIRKSHDDAAAAAKKNADDTIANLQRVSNAARYITAGVSSGLSGVDLLTNNRSALPGANPSARPNRTGYDLLTNGAAPLPATVVPAPKTGAQRADDAVAQIIAGTTPNKGSKSDAEKLIEKQRKALEEFTKTAAIALKATQDMAAAYLGGADNVRAMTIQQEIENEVLKTGEQARQKVTAAINAQHDAQDRLDIAKKVAELRVEVSWLEKEAVATLAGQDAIDAFNVAKSVQTELIGKNIAVGSQEYKQLVAVTEAQLKANKAVAAAGKANDIVDRLNPETKLLREYTEEQNALIAAMDLYPAKADLYRDALVKLGNEYEVNKSKATIWGQMTEAAVDRIDGVFADAWANIGEGAGNLWDNLKKGFRQTLGEIVHMLTTKPLLNSFANWLTGTDNGKGFGATWEKILGGGGGSSGGGGGVMSFISTAKTALDIGKSGFVTEMRAGFAQDGITGAFKSGADYVSNAVTSAFTVGSETATAAAQTAAQFTVESTTAGLNSAAAEYASQFGAQLEISTGAIDTALSASNNAFSQTLQTLGDALGVIGIAYSIWQSYDAYGFKGAATTAGFATAGFYLGSIIPGVGNLVGAAIGAVIGSLVSSAAFGSGEKYPELSGSASGTWKAGTFTDDGWVEGWKEKQPKFGDAVNGELGATVQKFTSTMGMLYSVFGNPDSSISLDNTMRQRRTSGDYSSAFLATLNNGTTITGIQQHAGGDVVAGIKQNYEYVMGSFLAQAIVNSDGIPSYFKAQFMGFARNWESTAEEVIAAIEGVFTRFNGVNSALKQIRVSVLEMGDVGLQASDAILNMVAKFADLDVDKATAKEKVDALNEMVNGYYQAFFSDQERFDDLTKSLKDTFLGFNMEFPDTREAYRKMVEDIDVTTGAGQAMFATMMGLADSADAYFKGVAERAQAANEALLGQVDTAFSALQRSINAQKTSINDMIATARENASGLTSISNALGNALKALRGDSDDAVRMLRDQAKATVVSALAIARAGGSLSKFEGLEDALSVISDNDTSLYASLEDFNREQGRNANLVAELNKLNGKQLSASDKTIKALEAQLDGLDRQLEFAQAQMDALNGVDNSVKSVADAIKEMNAAVVAAISTITGKISPQNAGTLIDSIYQDKLGRPADAGGKQYWTDQLTSGSLNTGNIVGAITNAAAIEQAYKAAGIAMNEGASYWAGQLNSGALTVAQLNEAVRNAAIANGSIPARANGGLITGPGTGTSDSILARLSNGEYVMRAAAVRAFGTDLLDQMNAGQMPAFAVGGIVGEGPVLQITRPAQIYAGQAQARGGQDGGNAELLDELRQLRQENKQAQFQIAKNTQRIETLMRKWDEEGTPQERDYA